MFHSFNPQRRDRRNEKARATRASRTRGGTSRKEARCQVESLEGRTLFNAVVKLTLIDAVTDKDIMPLTNGQQINLQQLPSRQLNVRAETDADVKSVRFAFDANTNYRTESGAPFAFAGDDAGNYKATTFTAGAHTLKATPFSGSGATGAAGAAMSVSFNVIDQTDPAPVVPPAAPKLLVAQSASDSAIDLSWTDGSDNESGFYVERSSDGGANFTRIATLSADSKTYADTGRAASTTYHYRVLAYNPAGSNVSNTASATTAARPPATGAQVTGLMLVNADTDKDIQLLTSGATLNFATLGTRNLNVRAITANAASVRFALDANSNFRTESGQPFTLAGDNGGNYNAWTPALGGRVLSVTPFAGSGATGAAGAAFAVNFTVTDTATPPPAPTAPAAPSALSINGVTSSSATLKWTDNASNESGFYVARSSDGVNFSNVGTTGGNATGYTDNGLNASSQYTYRVYAYNTAGNSSTTNTAVANTTAAPVGGVLVSPPQSAVNAAISATYIRYNRSYNGGTNAGGWGGASITLAVASHAGNTTADARLLGQIRYTITGGNEPYAAGGYTAQHERHVTGMFAIAKHTPRIWNQLSSTEKHKIDLVMKGTLVASAFTTSDNNPYVKAGTQQYALDGDSNLNRGWNPNYREGMIGGMLVGVVYFGGGAATQAILDNFNHASFLAELNAAGLSNLAQNFNWKAANPSSNAPSASTIESAIKTYRYQGIALTNPLGIYGKLAEHTYGKRVTAGLNNGAGIGGGGKILAGAGALPNLGQLGMLAEFDSVDANGARSSARYAYDGFRPHQTNVLTLIVGGYWDKTSPIVQNAVKLMNVGNTDLFYKLDNGYMNYQKGKVSGDSFATDTDAGYEFSRPLWESVLKAYHGVA